MKRQLPDWCYSVQYTTDEVIRIHNGETGYYPVFHPMIKTLKEAMDFADNQNKMLGGTYDEKKYPKYCNYDAIDCKKIVSLPDDYFGVIGVPITFFDCYCPSQFKVLECHEPALSLETIDNHPDYKRFKSRQFNYNGEICQKVYHRIFIKRKVEK